MFLFKRLQYLHESDLHVYGICFVAWSEFKVKLWIKLKCTWAHLERM